MPFYKANPTSQGLESATFAGAREWVWIWNASQRRQKCKWTERQNLQQAVFSQTQARASSGTCYTFDCKEAVLRRMDESSNSVK